MIFLFFNELALSVNREPIFFNETYFLHNEQYLGDEIVYRSYEKGTTLQLRLCLE